MKLDETKIDTLLSSLRGMLESENPTLFQIFNEYVGQKNNQGFVDERMLTGKSIVLHFGNSSEATLKEHLLAKEPFAQNCWVIEDSPIPDQISLPQFNHNWVAIPSMDCEEDEQSFYIVEKKFWVENGHCQDHHELPNSIPDFGFGEHWEQIDIEGIEYQYYGDGNPLEELKRMGLDIRNWDDHPKRSGWND